VTPTTADWDALQAAIAGDVVLPGAPDYESVRKPVMARFEHVRPEALVRCATPADVAATLAVAGGLRLPTAIRSGGHSVRSRRYVKDLTLPYGSVGSSTRADIKDRSSGGLSRAQACPAQALFTPPCAGLETARGAGALALQVREPGHRGRFGSRARVTEAIGCAVSGPGAA